MVFVGLSVRVRSLSGAALPPPFAFSFLLLPPAHIDAQRGLSTTAATRPSLCAPLLLLPPSQLICSDEKEAEEAARRRRLVPFRFRGRGSERGPPSRRTKERDLAAPSAGHDDDLASLSSRDGRSVASPLLLRLFITVGGGGSPLAPLPIVAFFQDARRRR